MRQPSLQKDREPPIDALAIFMKGEQFADLPERLSLARQCQREALVVIEQAIEAISALSPDQGLFMASREQGRRFIPAQSFVSATGSVLEPQQTNARLELEAQTQHVARSERR
ncbi:MAG TPA: hypothetical protein VIF40_19200 [Methylosinus sp.]|uniref:hypothetical protein n=1 Tax=Methylosinus sp. TaxID=427 RepID=UPI002F955A3C